MYSETEQRNDKKQYEHVDDDVLNICVQKSERDGIVNSMGHGF